MATIYCLTHGHLDFGSRSLLAAECEHVGIRKPLIVTDAGVRAAGVLQKVLDALPASLQGPVYDRTPSTPSEGAVREAAALCRERGCDGLIAVAHCTETFMAPAFNPPADGIALDGLERGWAHIERATRMGRTGRRGGT